MKTTKYGVTNNLAMVGRGLTRPQKTQAQTMKDLMARRQERARSATGLSKKEQMGAMQDKKTQNTGQRKDTTVKKGSRFSRRMYKDGGRTMYKDGGMAKAKPC